MCINLGLVHRTAGQKFQATLVTISSEQPRVIGYVRVVSGFSTPWSLYRFSTCVHPALYISYDTRIFAASPFVDLLLSFVSQVKTTCGSYSGFGVGGNSDFLIAGLVRACAVVYHTKVPLLLEGLYLLSFQQINSCCGRNYLFVHVANGQGMKP